MICGSEGKVKWHVQSYSFLQAKCVMCDGDLSFNKILYTLQSVGHGSQMKLPISQ